MVGWCLTYCSPAKGTLRYSIGTRKIAAWRSQFLETKNFGTNAARKTVRDIAYVAYFRATGLDMDTQREPTRDNLVWVKDELEKQNKLLGIV